MIVLHFWKGVSLLKGVAMPTGMLVWKEVSSAGLEVGLQTSFKTKANPSFWLLLSITQGWVIVAIPPEKTSS